MTNLHWRHTSDGTLIHFPDQLCIPIGLQHAYIIKPGVIVMRVGPNSLLILKPSLAGDDCINGGSIPMLLLMTCVLVIECQTLLSRKVIQSIAVHCPCAFMFPLSLLELGEGNVKTFIKMFIPKKLYCTFQDSPRSLDVAMGLLKAGVTYPVLGFRMDHDKLLVNLSRPLQLFITQLKLDVSEPRLLIWLPLHPALKHLWWDGGSVYVCA